MPNALPTLALCLALFWPILAYSDSHEKDTEQDADEISTTTCQDLYDLYAAATPKEGKDPEQLARAQDDVLYFVIWVHGFISGRDGLDLKNRPLNRETIKEIVSKINGACKPNPDKLLAEVLPDIR